MTPKLMDGKVKVLIKHEDGETIVFEGYITEVSITDDVSSMNKEFQLKGVMTSTATIEHELKPQPGISSPYSSAIQRTIDELDPETNKAFDELQRIMREAGHMPHHTPLGSLDTPEEEIPLYKNLPKPKVEGTYTTEPANLSISGIEKMKKALIEFSSKVIMVPPELEKMATAMMDPTEWSIEFRGEATLEEALKEIQDDQYPEEEQPTQNDAYLSLVTELNKQIPIGFVKGIQDGIADVDITPGAFARDLPTWEYPRYAYRYEATIKNGKGFGSHSSTAGGDDSKSKKDDS